jgi:hypothetical protein
MTAVKKIRDSSTERPEDLEDHDFAVKSRRTPIDPVPH